MGLFRGRTEIGLAAGQFIQKTGESGPEPRPTFDVALQVLPS